LPTGRFAHTLLGPNGVQRIESTGLEDRTHCLIRSMVRENYSYWPEALQSGTTNTILKLLEDNSLSGTPCIYKIQSCIHYYKLDHMLSYWPRGQRKELIEPFVTIAFGNMREEQLAQELADNLALVAYEEAAAVATEVFQSSFL
jgi:hypothetical protein